MIDPIFVHFSFVHGCTREKDGRRNGGRGEERGGQEGREVSEREGRGGQEGREVSEREGRGGQEGREASEREGREYL